MEKLIFTIDVEEWHHAENLRPYLDTNQYDNNYSTIPYTYEILDILDLKSAKGTFFFLGCIAKSYPELVREVSNRGHEIASHGLDHQLLWNMDENQTNHDISTSTSIIEDISGTKVTGYRSPCFSQNKYLMDALIKNGYKYTSMQIQSTFHDRYESNTLDGCLNLKDLELPVAKLCGLNIVATGGGWFRFFPLSLQNFLLEKSKANPKIFYCHPWDFGKNFWGNSKVPFLKKFRHTVGVQNAIKKFTTMDFSKKTLSQFV